ncbi:MAG: MBL fold metallo-hydrolase [Patescibacteria group bacterium]
MQIIWYGESCFKIIYQNLSLLTDPFSPQKKGFKNPRITSEIVIFSSPEELKDNKKISGPFVFSGPGEYEIKNIFIQGFPHFEKKKLKTIYKLEGENINICFLGNITKRLNDEILEKLGDVEIVLLPIGEKRIESLAIRELIDEIQPKLILPSCWQKEKEVLDFAEKIGFKKGNFLDKLKIRKKDLLQEKIELVILKPSH